VTGTASALLAVAIFAASSIPAERLPSHPSFFNSVAHFSEYLILGALVALTFATPGRRLMTAALIGLIVASAYGLTDEIHQFFVVAPGGGHGRNADLLDWLVDTAGAATGVLATSAVLHRWRASTRRHPDQTPPPPAE
jgi:VanZ family protein